jgi:hypothetical protein
MAFVPVSFELYEDSSIAQQIATVFADSKAAEEARVFTMGNGTTEPKGIITAISAAGGSVIATGTNALANGDVYAHQNAFPARWRPRTRFIANLSIINGYRQLLKASGRCESLVDDSGPVPRMAGWEIAENSNMDGTLTAGTADYVLLSGDFQQFDRRPRGDHPGGHSEPLRRREPPDRTARLPAALEGRQRRSRARRLPVDELQRVSAVAKKQNVLLVARQTITVDVSGEPYPLLAGVTRARSDHPVAREHAELFTPVEPQPPDVEQATAAPGEKRRTKAAQ